MKLSCSPAIRNCGLNIEYAFHLLCKYEGNVEKALHALLRDTLVVDDYVYAGKSVGMLQFLNNGSEMLMMKEVLPIESY